MSARPRFLKPGAGDGDSRIRNRAPVLEERRGSEARIPFNNPYASLAIAQQRPRLPIYQVRNHILYLLETTQTLVVVGETGCGKSTQLPQYLLEAGWATDGRRIGVTQPRRVATLTLAQRVAEEKSVRLGAEVGYVVRFDDHTSASTKVKFMTDGILIRELMSDPLLTQYSILMIDEAHERSLNSDILLGLLRKVLAKRSDLRLIVSSATLDAKLFRDYFNLNDSKDKTKNTAAIISVEGRQYPVQIHYVERPVADFIRSTVRLALQLHKTQPPGDILAFLTGQDEVDGAVQLLSEEAKRLNRALDRLWVLPMYGALPVREQLHVFDSTPAGRRKVVLATNIAEASITIPGIAYVIDAGFVKLRAVNPANGLESLMTVAISKASAEQRAGRAGRIRPGKAFRLYPEAEFAKLLPSTVPEMQRSELAPALLQLKALAVDNVLRFPFLSRPPSYLMIRGLELLHALGAIDRKGHLSNPLGFRMAEFPMPPMAAKALLASAQFGCSEEILSIVAMLQIQDVFINPPGNRHAGQVSKRAFSVMEGDHLTLLNVFSAFDSNGRKQTWCNQNHLNFKGLLRAANIRDQLRRLLLKYEIPLVSNKGLINETEDIRRCLVTGYFSHAAQLHYTGVYKTLRDDFPLTIYKGSAIMYREELPKWIIFNEVLSDSVRDISVIEPDWLYELAPHYYEYGTKAELAAKRARKH